MENVLVQYKGGGYDGCFWEWNYFAFPSGEPTNIFASGSGGCQTAKELLDYMRTNADDFYIYPLTPEGFHQFAAFSNPGHVHGVAKALTPLLDFELLVECECGNLVNPADMIPCSLQGCGGIAMAYNRLLCEDCYCSCMCSNYGKAQP